MKPRKITRAIDQPSRAATTPEDILTQPVYEFVCVYGKILVKAKMFHVEQPIRSADCVISYSERKRRSIAASASHSSARNSLRSSRDVECGLIQHIGVAERNKNS